MRIALAQINPIVGDLKGNQQKILDYINQAKSQEADLVVLPELALCGYPPEDLLHKEHFVQDNIKELQGLARKVSKITAIIGFVDMDKQKRLYNAAAVIVDGKIKGVYRKQELPNYGVFDEKRYFTAGDKQQVYKLNDIPFGVSICEDIWVDKKFKKAEIHINISSSPFDVGKLKERERLLKRRAKENKAFVCYANLVGGQDELVFDGGSMVVDPKGNILASCKQFEEDLIVVDLDAKKGNQAKKLSQIERVNKALVLGTHDYVYKNGFKKVLIGISGGIDSALVAAIAVKAIGKKNVIGVTMPSQYTSKGAHSDAKTLAQNLGIKLIEVPIKDVYKAYLSALKNEFNGQDPNIAEENIQARIRGNILMALSNKFGWLVLTTGNKSEVAVGYCTLYGDMSGGFAVIKDVPKTKVYELARFINKSKEIIPQTIIDRAPSAELRENQKDEDSLPPYDQLDELLKDYVEEHSSLRKMSRRKNVKLIKEIISLVDRNEYKRRQAPPGIKITQRSFDKDWRLPITNKYKEF